MVRLKSFFPPASCLHEFLDIGWDQRQLNEKMRDFASDQGVAYNELYACRHAA